VRRTLSVTIALLLLAYALHPLVPPELAQPVRQFFRELLRAFL
jgi:hypothetical protein